MFRNSLRFTAPLIVLGLVAGFAVAPAIAGGGPNSNMPVFPYAKKAGFSILTQALQAADLVGTINSTGPITVFAPTDAAFEKLEAANPGILASLLADPDKLREILLLHVVEGEVPSGVAVGLIGTTQKSINGLDLDFKSTTEGVGLQINNAVVIDVDKYAKNGVIHVMGDVILPKDMP
jgi:transforming growth factor-beta-induced protein